MWNLQTDFFTEQSGTYISRNNTMRAAWRFMEFSEPGSNDLLQEYFVPLDQFESFVGQLRRIVKEDGMNLLNVTVRYVNEDEEAVLSYARGDRLALVCLFNVPLSEAGQQKMKQSVQAIVDELLAVGGSYYLPYAGFPRVEQFQAAYPNYELFFQKKRQYDPDGLFMNYFYEQYGN